MRILVVDHNRIERDATLRLLPAGTHDITVAQDATAALAILADHEIDVVLIESTMSGITGAELVKRIRARESNTHTYIIMTAARLVPGDVTMAFLAGVDDFMRKPLGRDELLARVDGPSRVMRWACRVMATGGTAEFGKAPELTTLTAWTAADASICSEISDMLGVSLSVVSSNDVLDNAIAMSSITLSLPSEGAEVCVAIGIDGTSALKLAKMMLGEDVINADAVNDMMREIANVAAGAFKRMAAVEGRTFTTGVPTDTTPDLFRSPSPKARRQWIVASDELRISLGVEVELRVRETKKLPVMSLREGMVVSSDLLNESGALLMRAGTRITESHLAGMKRALGERVLIAVAEAA
jgi:CheY-like chemotaxis protein